MSEKLSNRPLSYEESSKDDMARDKAISDSVRSGSAGVTGEDFGVEEKRRIV